jgi:hypothetical protein
VFSARTEWDRTPNRLTEAVAKARASGADLIDLTESNPTRAGIAYPEDLLRPLGEPEGLRYEPTPSGQPPARAAVAAEYERHGLRVSPDEVLLTASTSEAYSFAFKLLCNPGDEVLIPQPSYPLFDFLAGLESAVVKPYPILLGGGEWHLDAGALEAAVGPRTRAVVVVNPNNPTGSFLKRDEAAALAEVAARHDLAIVSDEVFLDYAAAPDPRRLGSILGTEGALVVALGGLSKACGLPQLKLGWMVLGGPPERRREAQERLEIIADTYLSVGTPVQIAAPRLLERGAAVRSAIAARVAENRRALESLLQGRTATALPAEGGWYSVLRVPATRSEDDLVVDLVQNLRVLVHPGYFFGMPGEAFLVVSLLPPSPVFRTGMERVLSGL